jgi:hypothetical protein
VDAQNETGRRERLGAVKAQNGLPVQPVRDLFILDHGGSNRTWEREVRGSHQTSPAQPASSSQKIGFTPTGVKDVSTLLVRPFLKKSTPGMTVDMVQAGQSFQYSI